MKIGPQWGGMCVSAPRHRDMAIGNGPCPAGQEVCGYYDTGTSTEAICCLKPSGPALPGRGEYTVFSGVEAPPGAPSLRRGQQQQQQQLSATARRAAAFGATLPAPKSSTRAAATRRRKGIADRTAPKAQSIGVGYLGCQDACGTHGGREFEV